ncbi:hypothetical protein X975_02930, partial [Stegodyphus mimosarum]
MANGYYGQAGTVGASYYLPTIPYDDHRYTFFLYCQQDLIKVKKEMDASQRLRFNTKKFTKKYGLGNPVAANFFALSTEAPEPAEEISESSSESESHDSRPGGLLAFIPN